MKEKNGNGVYAHGIEVEILLHTRLYAGAAGQELECERKILVRFFGQVCKRLKRIARFFTPAVFVVQA